MLTFYYSRLQIYWPPSKVLLETVPNKMSDKCNVLQNLCISLLSIACSRHRLTLFAVFLDGPNVIKLKLRTRYHAFDTVECTFFQDSQVAKFNSGKIVQRKEHTRDKIIKYSGNEVGHGVLRLSVQETCALQEFQTKRTESKHNQWRTLCAFGILEVRMFAERCIGALEGRSHLQTSPTA